MNAIRSLASYGYAAAGYGSTTAPSTSTRGSSIAGAGDSAGQTWPERQGGSAYRSSYYEQQKQKQREQQQQGNEDEGVEVEKQMLQLAEWSNELWPQSAYGSMDQPTLLPAAVAQLISAASLAARISLRASALFFEAVLESAQCTTDTSMGITRRALVAALQSARTLHAIKQGSGGSLLGLPAPPSDASYLRVLDKYTHAGVYLVHNAFSLAELFAMSGFYLTKTVVAGGFATAEESVRLFEDLFGNTEPSRALASIIALVRRELTQDSHFTPSKHGTIATVSSLTKALTAFACLQNATHRRSLQSFKLRVIYDCTVINQSTVKRDTLSSIATSSSATPPHKRRASILAGENDPIPPNLRQAREEGHTWRDEVEVEELEHLSRRHSRAISSDLATTSHEREEEEDVTYELGRLLADSGNQAPSGRDGLDPRMLQQLQTALQQVYENQSDLANGSYQLELTTSTRTSTASIRSSSSCDDLHDWEQMPTAETVAQATMHETEESPEEGKTHLKVVVQTLTHKLVKKRNNLKRVFKTMSSSSSSDRLSSYQTAPHSRANSANSDSSAVDTDSDASVTPRQSGVATPHSWTNSSMYMSAATPSPTPAYTPDSIIAPLSPPASPEIDDSQPCFDEPAPKAGRRRLSSATVVGPCRKKKPDSPKPTSFPAKPLVDNLQRFCKYSSAAYGQHFLRILGLGNVDYTFPTTGAHHANVHAFAHHCGIKVENILLSSFTPDRSSSLNNTKAPPIVHYISVDHEAKAIVLTLRGTLGLGDLLVDLTADYEPVGIEGGVPSETYLAHRGMLQSARQLKAQRGIVHDTLKTALNTYPAYGLVVTGHSLGGGVAALLSMLWACPANQYLRTDSTKSAASDGAAFVINQSSGLPAGRALHCFAYGIPCVASPDLARWSRGLVTSIVHHLDVVATLSLGTLRDFKQVAAALWEDEGRVAEEVVGRVIGLYHRRLRKGRPTITPGEAKQRAQLSDVPYQSSLMSQQELAQGRKDHHAEPGYNDPDLDRKEVPDDVDLDDWLWSLMKTLRATADTDKLYPPGEVYVVESHAVFVHEENESDSAGAKQIRKEGKRVILRYSEDVAVRFSEPIFSRSMFLDHSPSAYEASLDALAQAVLP